MTEKTNTHYKVGLEKKFRLYSNFFYSAFFPEKCCVYYCSLHWQVSYQCTTGIKDLIKTLFVYSFVGLYVRVRLSFFGTISFNAIGILD